MANEIKNAKDGLVSLISGITGLKVLDYPPDSVNEFPVAIVLFQSIHSPSFVVGSAVCGRTAVWARLWNSFSLMAAKRFTSFVWPTTRAVPWFVCPHCMASWFSRRSSQVQRSTSVLLSITTASAMSTKICST